MSDAGSPRVAIVILNWNGRDDTLACLASLRRLSYPAYQVVVVDNGSTDGSVEAIRAKCPDMPLIETGANLGYVGRLRARHGQRSHRSIVPTRRAGLPYTSELGGTCCRTTEPAPTTLLLPMVTPFIMIE